MCRFLSYFVLRTWLIIMSPAFLLFVGVFSSHQVKSDKVSKRTAEVDVEADFSIPKGHLQPLGDHQPPEGHIPELWFVPNASTFYHQYVALSKPVIFKGAAKISDAYKLWSDTYLSNKYGHITIGADYGKKENRERPADDMTLGEFLKTYNKTDRYLVSSLPEPLQKEFSLPKCLLCGGFTERLQDSVLWFSSGGTKSFLHIDNIENINCLFSGHKEWFFIDKENTKKIDIDHGEGEYCGVDVDKVDMFQYPFLRTIPWWKANMHSGDCMYIPYGWAHQVRSYSRNLAVNIWWAPMTYFNESNCHGQSKGNAVPLSEFQFVHGEQLRFLTLNLLENYNGGITFDVIHNMILHEHSGEHLITKEGFNLLDQNKDGILEVKEVESQPAEIIEIALQKTPPGEVNIRGMSQKRDPRITKMLENQQPYVQEFLLRLHKTPDDIAEFLRQHGKNLHPEVLAYLNRTVKKSEKLAFSHEEL